MSRLILFSRLMRADCMAVPQSGLISVYPPPFGVNAPAMFFAIIKHGWNETDHILTYSPRMGFLTTMALSDRLPQFNNHISLEMEEVDEAWFMALQKSTDPCTDGSPNNQLQLTSASAEHTGTRSNSIP